MLEVSEGHPLSQEVKRHLKKAITPEISPLDDRIGILVGTGIELVQLMIYMERLYNFPSLEIPESHHFLIHATPGLFPKLVEKGIASETVNSLLEPEFTHRRASIAASYYGQMPYLFSQLDLPLNDKEIQRSAYDCLTTKRPFEQLTRMSILARHVSLETVEKIPEVMRLAKERKGVLLGVKKDTPFTVIKNNPYSPDLVVSFGPMGLSYKDIVAVQPLGAVEKNFFRNFRDN